MGDSNYYIQRGSEQFKAPDLTTLKAWCKEGRVVRSDLVFHPSFGSEWRWAGTVPELYTAFPPVKKSKAFKVVRFLALSFVVCLTLFVGVVVVAGLHYVYVGTFGTSAQRAAYNTEREKRREEKKQQEIADARQEAEEAQQRDERIIQQRIKHMEEGWKEHMTPEQYEMAHEQLEKAVRDVDAFRRARKGE